ncbi:hypothetical protein D3C83_253860 [compost metagenome]
MESEADAGHGGRKVGELAAVQRKALDSREVHDLADRRGGRRKERRVSRHRDRLGDGRHS